MCCSLYLTLYQQVVFSVTRITGVGFVKGFSFHLPALLDWKLNLGPGDMKLMLYHCDICNPKQNFSRYFDRCPNASEVPCSALSPANHYSHQGSCCAPRRQHGSSSAKIKLRRSKLPTLLAFSFSFSIIHYSDPFNYALDPFSIRKYTFEAQPQHW